MSVRIFCLFIPSAFKAECYPIVWIHHISLSIHLSVDSWVISISWLLWIILQWTWESRCFWGPDFNSCGYIYPEMGLVDCAILHIVIHSCCTILHSHQVYNVLISLQPHQCFFKKNNGQRIGHYLGMRWYFIVLIVFYHN